MDHGVTIKNRKQPLDVDSYVGIRMRIRRVVKGISQEQLAEMLDISFQQLQKYEKGINRISAGRLYEIAQILEVPVGYFYEGFDEKNFTAYAAEEGRVRVPRGRKKIIILNKAPADEESD